MLVAVMTGVERRWRSIILNPRIKTSGFLTKVTLEVENGFEQSARSANFFVPIAFGKSMPSCSFSP